MILLIIYKLDNQLDFYCYLAFFSFRIFSIFSSLEKHN